MPAIDISTLTGQVSSNIDFSRYESGLHVAVVPALLRLQQRARDEGFDLAIASSFRSFERQLLIWNEKAAGNRPLYNDRGELLASNELSPWALVQAILRWSALPGASRHHWGTDLDIYDRAAVPEDYQLQLSVAEVSAGGPFDALHQWFDLQLQNNQAEGFFRPYSQEGDGVAVERWHLSYAPLAIEFQRYFTLDKLVDFISEQELALKATVLENIEEIYQRFVTVAIERYPDSYRHGV